MKTLFRYVLAATLAVTIYSFSNGGSGNIAVLNDPNEKVFEIVDSTHNNYGDIMTRQQIEDDNLCPEGPLECATSVDGLPESILWSGPDTKF